MYLALGLKGASPSTVHIITHTHAYAHGQVMEPSAQRSVVLGSWLSKAQAELATVTHARLTRVPGESC